MTIIRFRLVQSALLLICFGFLPGCQPENKLVYSQYDRIRVNASNQGEVEALIGEPDNKLGDLWMYQRPDAHLTVMIDFDENGRVTRKQWIDAMKDDDPWTDSSDHAPAAPATDTARQNR